jgi:hypothetical protein
VKTWRRLPKFKTVKPEVSGCKCCHECDWWQDEETGLWGCPYGGPFGGYRMRERL